MFVCVSVWVVSRRCKAVQGAIGDRVDAAQRSFDALNASLGPELSEAAPPASAELVSAAQACVVRAEELLRAAVARAEVLALDANVGFPAVNPRSGRFALLACKMRGWLAACPCVPPPPLVKWCAGLWPAGSRP